MVSTSFMNIFKNAKLTNLEMSTSHHCPIMLELIIMSQFIHTKPFRFRNAWMQEPMCRQLGLIEFKQGKITTG